MTSTVPRPNPITTPAHPTRTTVKDSTLLGLLQTIGHKVIDMLYPVTSMTLPDIRASTRQSRWAASIRS